MMIAACTTTFARQLSPDEALARVSETTSSPAGLRLHSRVAGSGVTTLQLTLTHNGINTVYVFDRQGGGYVIVAADDAAPTPLLAYSPSGSIDVTSMPPAMEWWLSTYSRDIAEAALSGRNDVSAGDAPSDRPDIAPLVPSRWDQTSPYDAYTPMIDGKHTPTGCVATTMAQIMYTHRWPEKGTGSHYYMSVYTNETISANFADSTFRWTQMTDTYTDGSTAESVAAVASLMKCCGVSVDMGYSANASYAGFSTAGEAMILYFDYDKSMRSLKRNYFGYEEWTGKLYAELSAGRPVIYGGSNPEVSHAFICDGYQQGGYFHFNWGWGGWCDGYFLITDLNPKNQGVGGGAGGYNDDQTMIIGVRPSVEGSAIQPVIEFSSDFEALNSTYTRSTDNNEVTFYDSRGIYSVSYGTIDAIFGVRLTDSEGNVSYVASTSPQSMARGSMVRSYSLPAAAFPQSGEYEVVPVVKVAGGEWYDGLVKMSNVRSLQLTASAETLVFRPSDDPGISVTDLTLFTPIFNGREAGIRATVTNTGSDEYFEYVMPALESETAEVALGTKISVDIAPGATESIEWVGTFSGYVTPGQYKLMLVDASGKKISASIPVTVEETSSDDDTFTGEISLCGSKSGGLTESNPIEVSGSDFYADITVHCTGGYFTDNVTGLVFDGTHGVVEIYGNFIGVKEGQTATVHLTDSAKWLNPGTVYTFYAYGPSHGRFLEPCYFRATPSGIEEVVSDITLGIYPNPATDVVSVSVSGDRPVKSVSVISLGGIEMIHVEAGLSTDAVAVDVASLQPGIYIVKAVTDDGMARVERLIKR